MSALERTPVSLEACSTRLLSLLPLCLFDPLSGGEEKRQVKISGGKKVVKKKSRKVNNLQPDLSGTVLTPQSGGPTF